MNFVQKNVLGETRISLKFFFIAAVWESGVEQNASLMDTFVSGSENTILKDFSDQRIKKPNQKNHH